MPELFRDFSDLRLYAKHFVKLTDPVKLIKQEHLAAISAHAMASIAVHLENELVWVSIECLCQLLHQRVPILHHRILKEDYVIKFGAKLEKHLSPGLTVIDAGRQVSVELDVAVVCTLFVNGIELGCCKTES